uniref:Putative salivary secreted protein n=1 Tax=Ixodes ricinus TaxID=34613 RepID=A0A090XEB7_IXORI
MRSSFIFCLLAMFYIVFVTAYAEPDCPNHGMKRTIPGVPCLYSCEDYSFAMTLHPKTNGTRCTGPGVRDGKCEDGECKKNP